MRGLCGQDLGDGIWIVDSGITDLNVVSHLIKTTRAGPAVKIRCSAGPDDDLPPVRNF